MSLVKDLGEKYCNLPNILERFDNEIADADNKISSEGKLLETSLSKNSAWLHYYDSRRNKLTTLVNHFKMEANRVRGELYREYKENYSRALTSTDISKYIESDPKWLLVYGLLIEIQETEGEYKTVVESLKTQNFSLGHITKLRLADLEFTEI